MKLNWLGRAAMNSTFRRLAQDYIASRFESIGGLVEGGHVLELGCGGGYGVGLILRRFKAAEVDAIDLDPRMIDVARQRLFQFSDRLRLHAGDATSLAARDATFDAVFDFGAIHIEREWEKALKEVRRVLKPGGRFYFEMVTSRTLRLPYPLVTEGFRGMKPPDAKEVLEVLQRNGIHVGQHFVRLYVSALTGWVGDLVGVGRRE